LGAQYAALIAGDLALRRGQDAIHDTRVATRRYRSVLRVFADLFDPDHATTLDVMKERGLCSWWSPRRTLEGVHLTTPREADMDEQAADDRQFVGMDLHRRRSVLVRMNQAGERLETVRIVNDVDRLAAAIARAGESPEVVLEATYGWVRSEGA
jgi:hypothetical protein